MRKHAQVSIQFNWLFALIAGVIILAFFFSIIKAQQQRSSVEEATSLAQSLDTVFSSLTTNPDTTRSYPITNADLTFTCEPGISEYTIQGTAKESTANDLLFTPATLQGDHILAWTQPWSTPFDAGVFTYLASDRVAFIFINDSNQVIQALYDQFPGTTGEDKPFFTKRFSDDRIPTGMGRYVIITTTAHIGDVPTLTAQPPLKNEDVAIRVIDPEASTIGFDETGEATRPYLTREELWGAIFTEDASTYDCTMQKAITRLKHNAAILEQRAQLIQQDPDFKAICAATYSSAQADFHMIANNDYEAVAGAMRHLQQLHNTMQRGSTCPLIY